MYLEVHEIQRTTWDPWSKVTMETVFFNQLG
jgi:hypothetical protein